MITHVAIRYEGSRYSLPAPNRHHNVIELICKLKGCDSVGPNEQGFLDDKDNFLNRKEALAHALACNQVIDVNNIRANQLFSEDVW